MVASPNYLIELYILPKRGIRGDINSCWLFVMQHDNLLQGIAPEKINNGDEFRLVWLSSGSSCLLSDSPIFNYHQLGLIILAEFLSARTTGSQPMACRKSSRLPCAGTNIDYYPRNRHPSLLSSTDEARPKRKLLVLWDKSFPSKADLSICDAVRSYAENSSISICIQPGPHIGFSTLRQRCPSSTVANNRQEFRWS